MNKCAIKTCIRMSELLREIKYRFIAIISIVWSNYMNCEESKPHTYLQCNSVCLS